MSPAMETKKISFGFMKTKKVEKAVIEEKKDYIECVEEKAIKVVGGETVEEEKPLVIPMKPNTMITAEKLKEIAEKVEASLEEPDQKEIKIEPIEKPPENLTLDELAVRELLEDAKKEVKVEKTEITVPIPAKPILEGEKESTLDDYEAVPVQDFGLAMLRGMGWTPGSEQAKYKQPQLRPKGLGLGADKVIKDNQKKKLTKEQEDLVIMKNAFVKITTGKYNGCYGKVVSLDEDMGRVVVDIPINKETVSLSEFMMHPVTKMEYDKESKVINADSYEEYKRNENSQKSNSKHNSPKLHDKEASSSRKQNDASNYDNERKDKKGEDSERRKEGSERRKEDYERRKEDSERKKEDSERRKESDNSSNSRGRVKEDKQRNDRKRNSSSSEERSHSRRKDKKKHRERCTSSSSEERSHSRRKDKKKHTERSTSSSSEERSRSRRKDKKKHRERSTSSSEEERRNHRKSNKKKYSSSSDSEDSDSYKKDRRRKSKSPDKKRDIDKKRKGKKKKRDRDRSPHYKKHRK